MFMKRPVWLDYARAAVLVGAGIAIGLALPMLKSTPPNAAALVTPLPIRAARAHMVYSPEVRHPVEVEAKEQEHLVKWLSKRLDMQLRVPLLTGEGFELLGGRLLPGVDGPVAQFCTRSHWQAAHPTPRAAKGRRGHGIPLAQEGRSGLHWIDRSGWRVGSWTRPARPRRVVGLPSAEP